MHALQVLVNVRARRAADVAHRALIGSIREVLREHVLPDDAALERRVTTQRALVATARSIIAFSVTPRTLVITRVSVTVTRYTR